MTYLRLVESDVADTPFGAGTPLPNRLPPGRHGIPSNLVLEHQRLRLIAAVTEALAEHGYAHVTTTQVSEGAGVSTSTFYKHFGNLWDCLLAAYVASADRLCEQIECACAERDSRAEPLAVGIDAALSFLAAEPALAQLLSAQPPLEAVAISAARRRLVSRLAEMLRAGQGHRDDAPQPPGLYERLLDATLAYVFNRVSAGDAAALPELAPELTTILERPRRAA